MPTVKNTDDENPCKKDAEKRQEAFDRKLHGQPDEDLIDKINSWVKQLCETGGEAWTLSVPPNPTRDPDVLIDELIRRFNGQREAVDRLTKAEDILISQIGGLEEEHRLLRHVHAKLQEENDKLKQEVERLKEALAESDACVNAWSCSVSGKDEEIHVLQKQLENRKIEVEHLGKDGEIIRTPIDDVNEQQASYIAELTERYESVKKERDELRIKADSYEALIEESKAFWPKDMLKTIVDAFFASFASKKFPLGGIVSKEDREWLKKPEEYKVFAFPKNTSTDEIFAFVENKTLRSDLYRSEQTVKHLTEVIDKQRQQIAEQKDQYESMVNLCEEQTNLLVDYKIREQALQSAVDQMKFRIHELTNMLNLEKGDHSATRIKASNNASLQNRVEDLEEELRLMDEAFTREKMEHMRTRVQIGNKKLVIEALRAVNAELQNEVDRQKEMTANPDALLSDLRFENDNLKQQSEARWKTVESHRAEIEARTKAIKFADAQIAELRNEVDRLEHLQGLIRADGDTKTAIIQERDEEIGSLKRAIETLSAENRIKVEAIEEKNVFLRSENERNRKAVDEMNDTIEELNRKLYEVNNYVDTIADLRAENEKLRSGIEEVSSIGNRYSKEKDEMNTMIVYLKRENSTLVTENAELLKTVNDVWIERKRDLRTVYTGVVQLLEAFNTPDVDWSLKISLQKAIDTVKSKMI